MPPPPDPPLGSISKYADPDAEGVTPVLRSIAFIERAATGGRLGDWSSYRLPECHWGLCRDIGKGQRRRRHRKGGKFGLLDH